MQRAFANFFFVSETPCIGTFWYSRQLIPQIFMYGLDGLKTDST